MKNPVLRQYVEGNQMNVGVEKDFVTTIMKSQKQARIEKLLSEGRLLPDRDANWALDNDKEFKIDVNYKQAFLMHDFTS